MRGTFKRYHYVYSFLFLTLIFNPVLGQENIEHPITFKFENDSMSFYFSPPIKPSISAKISRFRLVIYNQEGKRVFKSKDFNPLWNGISSEGIHIDQGIYHWKVVRRGRGHSKYRGSFRVYLNGGQLLRQTDWIPVYSNQIWARTHVKKEWE